MIKKYYLATRIMIREAKKVWLHLRGIVLIINLIIGVECLCANNCDNGWFYLLLATIIAFSMAMDEVDKEGKDN